jgi:hypothetical protein
VAALGLALACLVGAMMVGDLRDRHALSSRGLRAEAVVVRLDHQDHRHGWFELRRTTYPVFAFTTEQGQGIETSGRMPVHPPLPEPDQRMPVVYDPADPTLVRDAAGFDAQSAWRPWLWAPFLAGGLALCVVALARPGRLRRP